MAQIYRVTASALRLRGGPDKAGKPLGVIMKGDQVVGIDDPAPTAGWTRVSWQDKSGYVASEFIVSTTPAASPAVSAPVLPAPPVERRDTDLKKLHPVVRAAVSETVSALNAEGIPFRVFEAFRPPERQRWLYAQGRTRPGDIVTKAQAWQSYHQYGLAVDLVLFRDNGWTWSDKGADRNAWSRMHEVARTHGLRPLDFEAPHVEFNGPDWRELQQGRNFPADGDDTWLQAVTEAAVRWAAAGGTPPAPPLSLPQRPALREDQ